MFGSKKRDYRELRDVIKNTAGGIYKRIDENRELLHLLMEKHPEVLAKSPWIEGWVRSNDHYFLTLLHSLGLPLYRTGYPNMPRPFPGDTETDRDYWETLKR